ncbi:MAG: T9SS type A sorting domain-containing protein [Bacteroidia bacterium]
MRTMYSIIGSLLFLSGGILQAQTTVGFSRVDSVRVYSNNRPLLFPWAGGMNFCQFSDIDLDQDGILDLFVFDRSGNKITTYLNKGTANQVDYVLAPQYVSKFPLMHDWALLRDYNCDGKMDIFTCTIAGFSIYRNTSTLASGLQFQLESAIVNTDRSPNSSHFIGNLFVSQVDVPAIRDIDGDGDLDVLTFENGGNKVEYHKNMSIERYGICDSIEYITSTNCWGEFTENATNSLVVFNTTCPPVPIAQDENSAAEHSTAHSGSCIECIEVDNDGDQDILLGDLSNPQITFLRNGGTNTYALMDMQDDSFPSYDVMLDLDVYGCGFHLDVNNDGKKDILFSPNAPNTSENFHSSVYYRNTNTNTDVQVTYVQSGFLQDSMLDFGEGTYPVFFDYDNDGDKDLFIGNYGYYQTAGPYESKIALLKNTGTSTSPVYTLITRDFANIHANYPSITGMAITFGDLDGDGDKDMIIGDFTGALNYFEKQPGPADNFVFITSTYQSIDIGNFAAPQLIDVDRDSKLDLIIGKQSGTISYYHNNGTVNAPVFGLVTTFFGNVRVNQVGYPTGFSTPCMYDDSGNYILIVGSERGWINRYDNIDGNLSGAFTRSDSMYVSIYEGGKLAPAVADVNNDGWYDMVIGNYAGGISLFYGDTTVFTGELNLHQTASFSIFPNPANESVTVSTEKTIYSRQFFIVNDLSGKEILRHEIFSQQTTIPVAELAAGIYICTLLDENGTAAKNKLIISR